MIFCRFLYILYIAVDANFKLKSKNRSFKDIEIAPGWALFVEESKYQRHLANYMDQPEVSYFCAILHIVTTDYNQLLDQYMQVRA